MCTSFLTARAVGCLRVYVRRILVHICTITWKDVNCVLRSQFLYTITMEAQSSSLAIAVAIILGSGQLCRLYLCRRQLQWPSSLAVPSPAPSSAASPQFTALYVVIVRCSLQQRRHQLSSSAVTATGVYGSSHFHRPCLCKRQRRSSSAVAASINSGGLPHWPLSSLGSTTAAVHCSI